MSNFLVISWATACQAPLTLGFLRQDYWSGLPFPSPGDLPFPGKMNPGLLHWQVMSLPLSHWEACNHLYMPSNTCWEIIFTFPQHSIDSLNCSSVVIYDIPDSQTNYTALNFLVLCLWTLISIPFHCISLIFLEVWCTELKVLHVALPITATNPAM